MGQFSIESTHTSDSSAKEIDSMIFDGIAAEIPFPPPWGKIFKGEGLNQYFRKDIAILQRKYRLNNISHSIALGKMEPSAFHRPYIRHAEKEGVDKNKCLRIYKIVSGSFSAVRNGEMHEYTPKDDYIIVHDIDIFSFKAGSNGCTFAIFDFPEFDLNQDTNEVL